MTDKTPTDAQQYLNVASQCAATATSELTTNVLVDGGSGTLRELLNDAADAIRAGWGQPAQAGEPFGYFHQLLNHEGKGNGVWLGAAERKVVEQAHTPGETSEEIVALYTTPQPTRPDPAYSEACNLATALFKKHFAHLPDFASGQAVWSLCDSTAGVISQIDNMVAGLVQPPTTAFSEDEL